MEANQKNYGHIDFICLIGYGSIGKGVLPLIEKHFTFDQMVIIDPVEDPPVSQKITALKLPLTPQNYVKTLDSVFPKKNTVFCVNVSVGTSSAKLIVYCQERGILYIDTVKEEWEGYYSSKKLGVEKRTNYALRHNLLKAVRQTSYTSTAVSCCGANPGTVSWFVKQALLNLAKDTNFKLEKEPKTKHEWACLMRDLGVKGVHIAQRDTQTTNKIRPMKAFWNTWSVDGFISEGFHQASEMGWGTHQKWKPPNAYSHDYGFQGALYLGQPGMNTMVKSWCPTYGAQFGFMITHDEAISISDYYTVMEEGKVVFRPTCHYAYHPCDDAINSSLECLGAGEVPPEWLIMEADLCEGMDQLGVLLYGHQKNAYWYGSQLTIQRTREIVTSQNATGLQVTSAILAGMVWSLQNREQGLVQADEMDYKKCLQVQHYYIEPVRGYYTDWNPLKNRSNEFNKQDFDFKDPWQFKNVIFHK